MSTETAKLQSSDLNLVPILYPNKLYKFIEVAESLLIHFFDTENFIIFKL